MKGAQSRQHLIDAALDLFAERGFAETSIGDVAERAGLSKGNVSYYFKTKADLLEWVTREREAQLLGRLNETLSPDATAHEAIAHFLDITDATAPELARVGCPVGTLCSELGKDDPSLQPYASHVLEALQHWLAEQMIRVVPPDQARDLSEHLIATLQGAAVLAHAYRDPDVVHRMVASSRAWLASTLPAELASQT